MKILFSLSILLISIFFILPKAYAQNTTLSIWPPIIQVTIQPGKSITQVYKIENLGDPTIASTSISAFTPSGENGDIELVDCTKVEVIGCESLNWFSLENNDIKLGSSVFLSNNKKQDLILKITIPDFASEGDYYNSLVLTSQAPPSPKDSYIRSTSSIVSNILINISKDGINKSEVSIMEFSTSNSSILKIFNRLPFVKISFNIFDSFEQIGVVLKAYNKGSSYTQVSGKISLSGFPGLGAKFNIPPQIILSRSSRILAATSSARLNKDNVSLYLPSGFYLGKYSLEAEIQSDESNPTRKKIYFYSLPINLILKLLVIIVILFIILILIKKFRNKD